MIKKENCILFSGGARGAEACFGESAQSFGVIEVNFTFEGHEIERTRGLRVLNFKELKLGDVNLAYISELMGRQFTESPHLRKVFQSIWYQITTGHQIFIIGEIMEDQSVKGGTGWGAELAKITNKPLFVFDQPKDAWFAWKNTGWKPCTTLPCITAEHFTGTGSRTLEDNGRQAIKDLFTRSFVAS